MEEVYKINENIAWREIDGQILILDSQQNQMAHDLNEMGTFIFLNLSQGRQLSEIITQIKSQYSDLSEAELNRDIESFIKKLLEMKLITK